MPIQIGDEVYVPRSVLGLDENDISPFYRTTVRERIDRSVRVDVPGGNLSDPIATSKLSTNFGVLIIRIGDFEEDGLLDPLAKAVLHYCRMLLPGDSVRLIELRTESEFGQLWAKHHASCNQLVLVGHGSEQCFMFGQTEVSAARLSQLLAAPQPSKKEVISLGCKTGYANFGKALSTTECVSHYLAPFHSIHGCVASLFAKVFLHERLLAARSPRVAFNHARQNLLGAASFRLWESGNLIAGQQ